MERKIKEATELIKNSKHAVAFTGAGISVESGIPPFRGNDGLWNKYDPIVLDINYFHTNTNEAWEVIRELFYDFFGKAKPNPAHVALADLEKKGLLKAIITQNIDNLHQAAGSKLVYEFHGTASTMVCTKCKKKHNSSGIDLKILPPTCNECTGLLKPDFIFFGEGIPEQANKLSFKAAEQSDVFIVIGTTGEVMPASMLPSVAEKSGAKIIEINTEPSNFTHQITDIFLEGKAGEILPRIISGLL
ncbi:MAG: RNA polymerase subunit sigma [Bacteroidetes bacterium 4572_117]|nr:MAG: RNA polymerase subunit sigma [Bacteroidetes bacterium 4572_117]